MRWPFPRRQVINFVAEKSERRRVVHYICIQIIYALTADRGTGGKILNIPKSSKQNVTYGHHRLARGAPTFLDAPRDLCRRVYDALADNAKKFPERNQRARARLSRQIDNNTIALYVRCSVWPCYVRRRRSYNNIRYLRIYYYVKGTISLQEKWCRG